MPLTSSVLPAPSGPLSATTSPPLGHGNFETVPTVYNGPYEYSVPGRDDDFLPQNVAPQEG